MTQGLGWLISTRTAADIAVLIFLKGSLVLLAAAALTHLLRHRSAALRHRLWVSAMVGLLGLPLLAGFAPSWGAAPITYPHETPLLGIEALETAGATDNPRSAWTGLSGAPAAGLPAASILLLVWWVGVAAGATHFVADLVRVAVLRRRSVEAPPLHPARALLDVERARLGIGRPVSLLVSPEEGLAATVGTLKPAVLLSPDVLEMPRSQLRSVVLHELAHIRRGDFLANLVGALATMVYWPNPLFWMARRRAGYTLEQACDDEVINRGVRSSSYAKVLMHFAAARPVLSPTLGSTTGFLRLSPTRTRILSILDPGLDRDPLRVRAGMATALLTAAVVALLGSLAVLAYEPGTGPTSALVAALDHPDSQVRARAARTLGRRDPTAVRMEMEGLLDDPSSEVRLAAMAALYQAGDPASIPAMAEVLTRPFDGGRGEHGFVLKLAIKTLGKTDHPDAVRLLEAQLTRPVAPLRRLALEELTRTAAGWAAAQPHLRSFAESDPDERNRSYAAEVLARARGGA